MQLLAKKAIAKPANIKNNNLPEIAILMAAFNEEACIIQKIESVFSCGYPLDLITFYIGSDASDDATDNFIMELLPIYPKIVFKRFEERIGKASIINWFAAQANAPILVLTDADTLFEKNLLHELVLPFENPKIGGVQAHFRALGNLNEPVSAQELAYNKIETALKLGESSLGAVIGAFGTCYAVRKSLYKPVPKGFLVDDFYIFMQILKQGFETKYAPLAKTTYTISGNSDIQFRRKVRIGQGNFQNLFALSASAGPSFWANYAFYGHKVIRWVGPFLLLICFIAAFITRNQNIATTLIWWGQCGFYGAFLIDRVLLRFNLQIKVLRFIGHFVSMNIALGVGFFRFLFTPSDGTWGKSGR